MAGFLLNIGKFLLRDDSAVVLTLKNLLLKEDGGRLLFEDGSFIKLE